MRKPCIIYGLEGHHKLGELPAARALLAELLKRDPNHAEAQRLLGKWGK